MTTDSQKAARDKWNAANRKMLSISFYPSDDDLYEHLDKQPNKAGYVKDLIRRDMESGE